MTRRALALCLFLLATAGFAGGVWWFSLTEALARLQEQGQADLSLASDRLVGELQQFREIAVLLSDHPTLSALIAGDGSVAAAETLLLRTADKTGTLDIHLADASGHIIASSRRNGVAILPTVGSNPAFRRAMQGALGVDHRRVETVGGRAYTFASPVFGAGGRPRGAVLVDVDMRAVEGDWVGDPEAIFFADETGTIFVSNRSELLFRYRGDRPPAPAVAERYGYLSALLTPFPDYRQRFLSNFDLWTIDGGPYLPARALHLTEPLPIIGMTGEALLDTTPARQQAMLQATVAAALCLGFGAMIFALSERRKALSDRLALEAAANAQLERNVAERTRALSEANLQLRRAQKDLVQAGKLSALGQMSAGISHELNQPLMAIRSYAENAAQFLERGRTDIAAENLGRISELARRMGRIIKNLRAFARQESEAVSDVDLVAVVEAALELSETKLRDNGVRVDWTQPETPVLVRGGEVRLQQVVMNLLSNAADAMADTPGPRLEISITRHDGRVTLQVADTGPGIAEPERIFDPFYSTKEVGQSEGMGLGLSISYGLVQSFGGAISGRNRPEGGAEFTVELDAARGAVAA
jgi:two-component system C4-dicarboxylate transport sensor histidine kinase DctB